MLSAVSKTRITNRRIFLLLCLRGFQLDEKRPEKMKISDKITRNNARNCFTLFYRSTGNPSSDEIEIFHLVRTVRGVLFNVVKLTLTFFSRHNEINC